MPANKKVVDLAREVLYDKDIYAGELHHVRGVKASETIGALNDILLVGIIPAPPGHSESTHLHGKPRMVLEEYIQDKDAEFLRKLILSARDQVDLIITRGIWKTL